MHFIHRIFPIWCNLQYKCCARSTDGSQAICMNKVSGAPEERNNWSCLDKRWVRISIVLFILAVVVLYHAPTRTFRHKANFTGAWTLHTKGRLGNQMSGYALLYALAKLNRRQAYVHPDMYRQLAPFFRITLPLLTRGLQSLPWKKMEITDNWMSDAYSNISESYVFLTGFPNSWTMYYQYQEEIMAQFRFHDHIIRQTWKTLSKLKARRHNPTFVGVHVRRGDYVAKIRKSYMGVLAIPAFLDRAMWYFRVRYQEPVFVVVSDDIEWCIQNINNALGDVYFPTMGRLTSPGEDLALAGNCNHSIMTIGTFGFWAASLARGMTLYLSNYTRPESDPYFKLHLPYWMGIPANL
ncbi:galactoside alpha-(1,2)-fucosyltransferase 1-like [Ornithodoros turicata]|uniref:galactoside alpha-(1,2)-fucosyltransferase 1-like n=1 Tax=Ornithodoros turicata TaxID=34597 RepID=UPI0031393960